MLSYRTSLNLYLDYLVEEKHIAIASISFEHFNAIIVSDFLEWLASSRHCTASTCNQRLMALKSFAKYVALIDISHILLQIEMAKVPTRKTAQKPVEFFSESGLKTLLLQPDSKTHLGVRDRFFMILMHDTGARCQEMLDLKVKHFELDAKYPFVYLHGKGRKIRTVPISPKTVEHLHFYLGQFHPSALPENSNYLFYTLQSKQKGTAMSSDAVAIFMRRYGEAARLLCSDIPEKVHPHQIRHPRAMHLYRGGMPLPLLADFLGHANLETTRIYAYADTEMKRNAIQKAISYDKTDIPQSQTWENDDQMIRKLYGIS